MMFWNSGKGESNVLGAQAMVGLAYGFVNDQVVLYLGYRALFVQDMEQTLAYAMHLKSHQVSTVHYLF